MRAKVFTAIVATVLLLMAGMAPRRRGGGGARRPPFSPKRYASRGAVGSMVPASGSTVSRRAALLSLTHGKLENSLLGGRPSGKPLTTSRMQSAASWWSPLRPGPLHLSWRGIVNKTDHLEIAVVSFAALLALALVRPHPRTLDSLHVALAVSLALNDSGFDILRFGALVAIAVFIWSRTVALRD